MGDAGLSHLTALYLILILILSLDKLFVAQSTVYRTHPRSKVPLGPRIAYVERGFPFSFWKPGPGQIEPTRYAVSLKCVKRDRDSDAQRLRLRRLQSRT